MTTLMDQPMKDAADGIPAPYGRACTNCAKAKCRCMYRDEEGDCERCHRLKKECVPSVSIRKRNGRRMLGSRTAQLEEKLEDLVTLLRNQTTKSADGAALATPGAGQSTPSPSSLSGTNSQTVESPATNTTSPENPTDPSLCTGQTFCGAPESSQERPSASSLLLTIFEHKEGGGPPYMPSCATLPTPEEAERNLDTFRTHMLAFFPFVYLHPLMTAKQLREEKPFLWFTIMSITSTETTQRMRMGQAIKSFLAQKLVTNCDKSFDLVFGLLVYICWSHFHKKEKPHLTIMTSLLNALVFDLNLSKQQNDAPAMLCFRAFPALPTKSAPPKTRTLLERRTLLACFYINTVISFDLKRLEGLRWTPYMDECLQVLSQEPEWLGDKVLANMVKIHLIIYEINRAPWQPKEVTPSVFYVDALRSQLQSIRNQMPPDVAQQDVIGQSLLYAEVIINESLIIKDTRDGIPANNPDHMRFEAVENCIVSVKAWFDNFCMVPATRYVGLTFGAWCQMAHCLMTLFWFTVREDASWSRELVRSKIDVFAICDHMIETFSWLSSKRKATSSAPTDDDIFVKSVKIMTAMKEGWRAEIFALDQANAAKADAGSGDPKLNPVFVDGVTTGPLAMPISQVMVDDAWLTDIFNVSWE